MHFKILTTWNVAAPLQTQAFLLILLAACLTSKAVALAAKLPPQIILSQNYYDILAKCEQMTKQ